MAKDIDEEDIPKLAIKNKVIQCVSACKKSYGGTFTAVEHINDLVKRWKQSQKSVHTVSDLEVYFFQSESDLPIVQTVRTKFTSKSEKKPLLVLNWTSKYWLTFRTLRKLSTMHQMIK